MITLYSGPLSLFARKVEIGLREKALPFERVMVPFSQTTGYDPRHPEVLALNPKGQVPVMTDDGLVLYDSTVIVEYLDEAYPRIPLYPVTPAERARCRLDELFADEILLQALRPLMHRTGPRAADPARRAAEDADALIAEEVLAGHHAGLDERLAGREFFGPMLSAADIALFMGLLFGRRLGGPSFQPYRDLSGWFARLLERPAFALAAAEVAEADRRLSVPVAMR
ncbi:glutathione S-transferase family protein [Bosea sp. 124]|uniref:glutathione S-transferase family protein n=1 Tax=Bosea sp. 124 TaxID=2135642 RepID=UPI000D335765|nr:glutathione S-transferase family protein [Bosea sp. 124]PTM42406.1 glutathione S-transferase [Bosea sp. 124]